MTTNCGVDDGTSMAPASSASSSCGSEQHDDREPDREQHRQDRTEDQREDDHRGEEADELGRSVALLPRRQRPADLDLEAGAPGRAEAGLQAVVGVVTEIDRRAVVPDLGPGDGRVGRDGAGGERVGDPCDMARRPTRDNVASISPCRAR